MKTPVHSKLLHAVKTEPSRGGSQKGRQYLDFEKVIQEEFGIIKNIGVLLSETSHLKSSSAQEFDEPNA